jgi:phosphoribosyl-AMP cyclohydrolase
MTGIPSEILSRLQNGDLIAAIAQDASTGEVLMLAWMNEESLIKTLQTKQATYWSRSRNKIWLKGESSGHFQEVKSIFFDCDADALLLKVNQTGAACHTGEVSCFHNKIELK